MWYKHFEYQIVLFDLTNISAIFQAYINHALHDLVDNFCIVYLDDILIFSKFKEEHYQHLELVIKCLWHAELYVNLKKCEFFKIKVKYLGFLVNETSLYMNLSCVKTVSDWHTHSSKIFHDIQIFIEFCNFYQHFIYNFADIAWSLHLLLCDMKKDRKSDLIADEWQISQQEAFEWLIDAFISASVLCHYDFQQKLQMKTNVSKTVYVSILS